MRVCYFGIFDPAYCRNKNILKGLRAAGVGVTEISDRTPGVRKYWNLFRAYWPRRKDFDAIIVGFPGQIIVPFAKVLSRKPVIFDLHVSYYDSIIKERKEHPPRSFAALKFFLMDFIACRLADGILLDTKEHVRYVSALLRIPARKFAVVRHGIDNDLFAPPARRAAKSPTDPFIISFHGYIQPLNGMDLVMKAMQELSGEPVKLWVIGGGSEYPKMQALARELALQNVEFFPPMAPPELARKVSGADIGLGFFSESQKIDRVIANKVYELMALKVPVLTGESSAMRECFAHGVEAFYCPRGDSAAIASAIRTLAKDPGLRARLAEGAYAKVSSMTYREAGREVLDFLERFVKSR